MMQPPIAHSPDGQYSDASGDIRRYALTDGADVIELVYMEPDRVESVNACLRAPWRYQLDPKEQP